MRWSLAAAATAVHLDARCSGYPSWHHPGANPRLTAARHPLAREYPSPLITPSLPAPPPARQSVRASVTGQDTGCILGGSSGATFGTAAPSEPSDPPGHPSPSLLIGPGATFFRCATGWPARAQGWT
ncbi:hypothetical protein WJX73_008130 [Symbiochloris irregularis]|uniref:Uncharacterized protein n=1 Tax=Symbiochloris irregularis TaxID=706552 RepID=A0AAW1P0Q5_9CHLO